MSILRFDNEEDTVKLLNRPMSRRGAIALGFGAVAAAIIPAGLLFAGEGGGGGGEEGGGSEGGGGGEDHNGAVALAWVWFDQGGWASDGGMIPTQGWDDDSMNYFLGSNMRSGLVVNRMNLIAGGSASPLEDNRIVDGTNDTEYNLYRSAAQQALNNARNRAGTAHARVVGVGWSFGMNTSHEWYINSAAYMTNNGRRRFVDLLSSSHCWGSRDPDNSNWVNYLPSGYHYVGFGNAMDAADGLSDAYGWGETVSIAGYEGQTWRQYLYDRANQDNPGQNYVWVVVAVADTEPSKPTGFLTVSKEFSE